MEILRRKSKVDYRKLNESKRFCNNDLIIEVAAELNVPEQLVKEIVEAQAKLAAKTIKSGTLQTVILPYLGKLKVNPYHVQKLMSKSMKN